MEFCLQGLKTDVRLSSFDNDLSIEFVFDKIGRLRTFADETFENSRNGFLFPFGHPTFLNLNLCENFRYFAHAANAGKTRTIH